YCKGPFGRFFYPHRPSRGIRAMVVIYYDKAYGIIPGKSVMKHRVPCQRGLPVSEKPQAGHAVCRLGPVNECEAVFFEALRGIAAYRKRCYRMREHPYGLCHGIAATPGGHDNKLYVIGSGIPEVMGYILIRAAFSIAEIPGARDGVILYLRPVEE